MISFMVCFVFRIGDLGLFVCPDCGAIYDLNGDYLMV